MCIRDRRSTVGTAGRLAVVVETRYNVTTLSRRNLGAVTWYRRWSGRRRSGHARAGIPSSATGSPAAAPVAGDVYVGGWGSAARTMPGGRVPLALERPSVVDGGRSGVSPS